MYNYFLKQFRCFHVDNKHFIALISIDWQENNLLILSFLVMTIYVNTAPFTSDPQDAQTAQL